MIQLAIVEDDPLYVKQLKEYIEVYEEESGNEIAVSLFSDGEDIVEAYKAQFDIILMDIQMRFMDGMAAAEQIRQMDEEVIIMFVTNMTNYAIRGYAVDALDYILKPVTYFAFSQKLDRAVGRLQKKAVYSISIPVESGIHKLNAADIYYIESEGHNLAVYTKKDKYLFRGKMQDMENSLQQYDFFRSNKGILVNMKHVDGVKDGCCMIGGKLLSISRGKKNEFMKVLASYISEMM